MENVTDKLLSEAVSARGEKPVIARRAGSAKANRLTPVQAEMLQRFDGARVGFTSNALLYDDAFRWLSARERQAVFALFKGGLLQVFEVSGPLSAAIETKASRIGAAADRHYLIRKAA